MDMIKKEISKQITYLMSEQNMQVKDLSALSTLSEKTINKLIDCSITPTISMLTKICNVFSINTCEFFDCIINSTFKRAV